MKLSAPVYRLKQLAKKLAQRKGIKLHEALDLVARTEGFRNWSLLAARLAERRPAEKLLAQTSPGELVLIGARPGHGKTLAGLELIVMAIQSNRSGWFFTLEWTSDDVQRHLYRIDELHNNKLRGDDQNTFCHERFNADYSDDIYAAHIIDRLGSAAPGTVVVVDYLQLLDQNRRTPELTRQIRDLKTFAYDRGLVIIFLSQIDRSFDTTATAIPDLESVRLPNPLDLSLFNRTCFLHNGVSIISKTSRSPVD